MENSVTSLSKALSCSEAKSIDSDYEESSWTFYFQDFLCSKNNNANEEEYSSGTQSPSLLSDAASSMVKKLTDTNTDVIEGFCLDRSKNLSFKKRKTKGLLVGDTLEDTASSPVNSPKLCCSNHQLDMNRKEKDDVDILEEKVGAASGQTDERREMGVVARDDDFTELKKKGLCLMPLSELANYLG